MKSYFSEKINSSYSISEYLAERGIYPKRESGERKVYLCPLPAHSNDTHPSFYVFDKGDHEDFCCFGCNAAGSIIQLVSEYENISIKDTITKLAQGINIDVDDIIDHMVAELTSVTREEITDEEDFLQTSMFISRISYEHMSRCDFDEEEIKCCEKMFKMLDKFMMQKDKNSIDQISENLTAHLTRRFQLYSEKKSNEEKEIYRGWSI